MRGLKRSLNALKRLLAEEVVSMRPGKKLLFALIVGLTGCVTSIQPREPLNLPDPEPLTLRPVKWVVVPVEEADGKIRVVFALTEAGYKSLSLNMTDILHYLALQSQILEEYRQYYEASEESTPQDEG